MACLGVCGVLSLFRVLEFQQLVQLHGPEKIEQYSTKTLLGASNVQEVKSARLQPLYAQPMMFQPDLVSTPFGRAVVTRMSLSAFRGTFLEHRGYYQ